MRGSVKLPIQMLKSNVWCNSSAAHKAIIATILMKANHKPTEWWDRAEQKIVELGPGEFTTSYREFSSQAEVSTKAVRHALKRLEAQDFLEVRAHPTYTLIHVCNWSYYESENVETQVNYVECDYCGYHCQTYRGHGYTEGIEGGLYCSHSCAHLDGQMPKWALPEDPMWSGPYVRHAWKSLGICEFRPERPTDVRRKYYAMLAIAYGERCLKCGARPPLHVDHVVPHSEGGESEPHNLQLLCVSCNQSKSANTSDYRPENWQELLHSNGVVV